MNMAKTLLLVWVPSLPLWPFLPRPGECHYPTAQSFAV